MEPVNYLPSQQSNPLQNFLQGLQASSALAQLKSQAEDKDRTEQYRTMLSDYMADPKYEKLQQLQISFPEQEKVFKPLIEQMDKRQLMAEQSAGVQITTALKNNDIDLANKILDKNIEAAKNSGLDTSAFDQVKMGIAVNPTATLGLVQWLTTHTMSPEEQEKFANAQKVIEETRQSQELFPSKIREVYAKAGKEESEAAIKAAEAKIAPQKVQADYQKVLEDIKNSQLGRELDKKRVQIAAMNAATAKETNGLKRQELQLQLAQKQQDFIDKVQTKQSEAQTAFASSDNVLNTIDRILAVPMNVRSSAHGPVASKLPTVDVNVANYEALMDTLGSQAFLSQVSALKGMGALSDAEGKKLQAGMQNLSLSQGAKQAEANVREMKNIVLKARKNLENKYGIKAPLPESTYKGDADVASIYSKYGIK